MMGDACSMGGGVDLDEPSYANEAVESRLEESEPRED